MKFSIIIPVYNVAPYLRECLDSVLAQTYTDWEAICIDDGSTDGSGVILDEYASRDSRFRVVHKANQGVSVARNVGLEMAAGDYFQFVDADDSINNDTLAWLDNIISSTGADGLVIEPLLDGDGRIPTNEIYIVEKPAEALVGARHVRAWTWTRVYKRTLFGSVRFVPNMRVREDLCFWVDALCIPSKWCFVEKRFYNYRRRSDSASHKMPIEAYLDLLRFPVYCLRRLREKLNVDDTTVEKFWRQEVRGLAVADNLANWREMTPVQRMELLNCVDQTLSLLGHNPLDVETKISLLLARHYPIEALINVALFFRRARLKILRMCGDVLGPRTQGEK